MKLQFKLRINKQQHYISWLLDKEKKQYQICRPSAAKRVEKRIKFLESKLLKKL